MYLYINTYVYIYDVTVGNNTVSGVIMSLTVCGINAFTDTEAY